MYTPVRSALLILEDLDSTRNQSQDGCPSPFGGKGSKNFVIFVRFSFDGYVSVLTYYRCLICTGKQTRDVGKWQTL